MAAWTPADIDLELWLDATDSGTVTDAGGGSVSQWDDKSGNARHVSQATGSNRPNYNGSNAITFDGTEYLFASDDFVWNLGDFNVFMVIDSDEAGADAYLFSEGSSSNTTPVFGPAIVSSPATNLKAFIRPQSGSTLISSTDIGTSVFQDGYQILGIEHSRDNIAARRNGEVALTAEQSINRGSTSFSADRFTIGGLLRTSFSNGCAFKIKEFIVTRYLTPAIRRRIEGYLAHKHSLTGSLPTGHPYVSAAPTTDWTPADMENVELWLDAADTTTITDTAGAASAWQDKSPNARTFSATASGGNPTTNSTTQNSLNTLDFDGVGHFQSDDASSVWKFLDNAKHSVFWVAKAGNVANPNTTYGLLCTGRNAAGDIGATIFFDDRGSVPRNEKLVHHVSNGSTTQINAASSDTFWPPNAYKLLGIEADPTNGTAANRSLQRFAGNTAETPNGAGGGASGSNPTNTLRVGAYGDGTGDFVGQIAEIIVVKGELSPTMRQAIEGYLAQKWAVDADLPSTHPHEPAAPILPADPQFNNTRLLLHLDDTVSTTTAEDRSYAGQTETGFYGGAAQSGTQPKYGDGSLDLDGTAHLKFPGGTDFDFSTDDFTVEMWVYFNNLTGEQRFLTVEVSNGFYPIDLRLGSTDKIEARCFNSSNSLDITITGTTTVSATTWYHVALVRQHRTWTLYLDGTSEGTDTTANNLRYNASDTFNIGSNSQSLGGINGYVDDVRVTKGYGSARYIANFTAPAEDYPDLIATAPSAPTIDTQPTNDTVTEGDTATFTVAATTSGGTLTYQWYDASDDSAISGETAATYDFATVLADNGFQTYVIVTDDNGSIQSDTVTLTVLELAPTIDTQPVDTTVDEGDDVTFTVAATLSAGGGSLSYQWYDASDDSAIPFATSTSYTISPTNFAMNGYQFYVIVTDSNGSIQSNTVTLTVTDLNPTITVQPADVSALPGDVISFSVTATPSKVGATLTYQWYSVDTGSFIFGQTTDTLGQTVGTDPGSYGFYVIVTDEWGSTQSNTATLTVGTGLVIDTQPTDQEGTGDVTFTVVASGNTGTITYQWLYADGTTIVGETSSTLTLDAATNAGKRVYVEVCDDNGCVASNFAEVILIGSTITYDVEFTEYRDPIFKRGKVILSEPLPAGAQLSIERKTPITNEFEAEPLQPFDAEQFEYQIDKMTFILQEIEGHYCDCRNVVDDPGGEDGFEIYCREFDCAAYETQLIAEGMEVQPLFYWNMDPDAFDFPYSETLDEIATKYTYYNYWISGATASLAWSGGLTEGNGVRPVQVNWHDDASPLLFCSGQPVLAIRMRTPNLVPTAVKIPTNYTATQGDYRAAFIVTAYNSSGVFDMQLIREPGKTWRIASASGASTIGRYNCNLFVSARASVANPGAHRIECIVGEGDGIAVEQLEIGNITNTWVAVFVVATNSEPTREPGEPWHLHAGLDVLVVRGDNGSSYRATLAGWKSVGPNNPGIAELSTTQTVFQIPHMFYSPDDSTGEGITVAHLSFAMDSNAADSDLTEWGEEYMRNFSNYEDPTPECIEVPT